MKTKRILSLLLSIIMILSTLPMTIFAENEEPGAVVSFTAQAYGNFLCAPQIETAVSGNKAESYGLKDSIENGTSVLDALVALHEIVFKQTFTKDTLANFLSVDENGYISKVFGEKTTAVGFVLNGAYPNDGTKSDWGGYNGTTVTTQKLVDGDVVEFFAYQDTANWSDELAWFEYKGNAITDITAAPGTAAKLTLKSSSYMMAYQYIDADAIHAVGSPVSGAQLALVDIGSGTVTDVSAALTDTNGVVTVTAPAAEGTYYLTAYIPEGTTGEPLIMSLTKIIVSEDAPQADPCALSSLSVASFDSNPDALELTPKFSSDVTEYSVPVVAFPDMDIGVFRSVYVKAVAESEDAVITAECNGVSVNITDASNWTMLNGALIGGKNNIIMVTVAESSDANAETRIYSVKVPMKPQTNTAPAPVEAQTAESITIDDKYTVSLDEVFTDADEVDELTYKVAINGEEATTADTNYSFIPDKAGEYTLTFTANDGTADSEPYIVILTVTAGLPIPESITIEHNAKDVLTDGVIVFQKGDKFTLTAYDQDGNETPVTWKKTSSWDTTFVVDEATGEVEVTQDVYSGTSYIYFKAISTLDETVSGEITIKATGIAMSEYNKSQTVALSADGQTAKTASITGGIKGYNIWNYNIPEGVAELAEDPETGNSIKFNVYRPGTISATFKLNINEELTGTATITVTGVAVEDEVGNNGKTYLGINTNNPNPTKQLKAYVSESRSVASWSSADESIAAVDENGLVTAKGVGSVIITAADSEGTTGGIKVVVQSEEIPYFENLQFLSSAIKDYSTVYAFAPTTTDYNLDIKTYSTSKLTLQNTTLFDDEKYNAVAEYTDINREKQSVSINSGAITYLDGIPFDESKVTITLFDKSNADNKTTYNFTVTRPRDLTKIIKSNGFVLVPDGRSLLAIKYNGYAEGTMFKLTEDGEFKTSWGSNLDTGVSGTHYFYKCFAFDDVKEFALNITGNTVYEHLRYSANGEEWTELPQGGGATEKMSAGDDDLTIKIQIIDDKTYTDNVIAEKDGFADCEPTEYTIVVSKASSSYADAQMLTATTDSGDWYPGTFNKNTYTYSIVVPSNVTEKVLTYTVAEGAKVKLGSSGQVANEDGVYTLSLTTSQKILTITSSDGKVTNTYNFKIQKKSAGYPDNVVDFLCINSQYTNGIGAGNGASPWVSLAGNITSIGNFGGYITYYYDDAITDNPNNKFGIDFYVYGNANKDTSTSTKTSFFEPGQVWVSEDGENWYALAGSAHYDDGVDWNYSITYTKSSNGKTAWTDNHGNSHNGLSYSGVYPSASIYSMNNLAASNSITLSGIALPARNGQIATVGEATDAYPVKWGYADCFVNGTKGKDVNPYTYNTNFDLQTNGFDLKWAVDENGEPVDVSDKEFHYVKIVSASNLWHSSFGEKSPEIAGVVKTTAQENAVGITSAPAGITISDGAESKVVNLKEGQQVYSVDIGDMKYVSVSVNGAAETDNIYINNTRISFDGSANGFKITKEAGEKKIRVVVQNEEKEPLVYLLKIKGTATETNDLVEGIKLDVSGSNRTATTNDGKVYTTSVGYRISSVAIYPVVDNDVEVTINGENIKDEYSLLTGENVFTIIGEKDGITHTVTLKITKDSAPASTGTITVYFTLLGDDEHGESEEVHTLKQGNLDTWISKTAIEVDSPATVLDVLEKALEGKHTFVNADGNYISKIDNLAEFDNGALSGWMYTLNGAHPSKGVAEQSVKNGDKIVFHYTDDYTQEKGSEKWHGSSSSKTHKKDDELKAKEEQKDDAVSAKTEFKENTFVDIKKDDWHYNYVKYVYENNLMQGTGNGFEPESKMTRAMLVTVLYRMANPEEKVNNHNFADVPEGQWYSDAVAWATENNIVKGVSENKFAPDEDITREQMVLIIYRYAKMQGFDAGGASNLENFTDAKDVSDWALDAIRWAIKTKLVNGTSETTLSPKATATRAQAAAILMRFCENIAK